MKKGTAHPERYAVPLVPLPCLAQFAGLPITAPRSRTLLLTAP